MGFPILGTVSNIIAFLMKYDVAERERSNITLCRWRFILVRIAYLQDICQPSQPSSDVAGFLFWEFPTMYIAQKLPLAKYLGECIESFRHQCLMHT